MTENLNLSIDKEIIRRTKRYSEIKNISVNQIVEKLLDELTAPHKEIEKTFLEKYGNILTGKVSDEQVEKIKEERMREKYGM